MTHNLTAGQLLEQQAVEMGPAPFLIYTETGQSHSFAETNAHTNRLAHGLRALGIHAGDTVGMMMPNHPDYLFASFAIRKLGAIEVGINGDLQGEPLERAMCRALPRVLILDEGYNQNFETLPRGLHPDVLICRGAAPNGFGGQIVAFEDMRTAITDNPGTVSDPQDASLMLLSGGTTGLSKGILTSHTFLNSVARGLVETYAIGPQDAVYAPWPLHHGTGSACDVHTALMAGARVVLAPRFSASRLMDHFRDFETTWMTALGIFQKIMWNMPPSGRDTDHQMRFIWGGPLPVPSAAFQARFNIPTYNCYGASDIGMVSYARPGDPDGCGGRVRDDYDVQICDPQDNPVPTGQIGEILVRPRRPGVILMEYVGQPDLMVQACRKLWFHTGDLGWFDDQGRIYFKERAGTVIRHKGEFISPDTVEHALEAHPAIARSAVIGVASDMGEQNIAAFVTLHDSQQATVRDIRAFCHDTMTRWMVPDHLFVVDEIPTSQAGKPIQPALHDLFANFQSKDRA